MSRAIEITDVEDYEYIPRNKMKIWFNGNYKEEGVLPKMTIDVYVESCELKFTALIVTGDVITHSTLQDTPKEHIEQCKLEIRTALIKLALEASEYRKES